MKTVGILGGMGPMATVDFFSKIVSNTKVSCDQDHLHIIIENNSNIPDRTAAILNKGETPLIEMINSAKQLEKSGVDIITMPCNTAHYYYNAIQDSINIPMLHIVEETVKKLKEHHFSSVMLLATEGTYESQLYQTILASHHIETLTPNSFTRLEIEELIYGFKKKNVINQGLKQTVLLKLSQLKIACVILGCTELPLIFTEDDFDVPVIDPTVILAKSVIKYAGGKIK